MVRILENNEPLPKHVNFACYFFQKYVNNRKRLEVVNKDLHRNFFDNTGRVLLQNIIVPPETTMPIIRRCMATPFRRPWGIKMVCRNPQALLHSES